MYFWYLYIQRSTSMNIVELKNIGLTYYSKNGETTALDDINFEIKRGEFVSIVGPSGCGKTTILSLISKLLSPTHGEIIFNMQSNPGYMFQKDQLFEWRTILKNIYLGLEITKTNTPHERERVHNLLKKYGLWDFKDKYPRQLSGGMRQRVALIRTLALSPELLLLDEAFSALDFQNRLKVCDDVKRILTEEKTTAILVTHDISEAISLSDKIIVLTQKPAKVKDIIYLNELTDLTPLERRENPKFSIYFDKIWRELQ